MANFNHTSHGITKEVLITKGQHLVDSEHDNRLKYCRVQLNAESLIVWNFEKEYLLCVVLVSGKELLFHVDISFVYWTEW